MRYVKSTFMWVIALAAVAGYSYMDFENTRVKEKAKEESSRLLPFDPVEVLAITLTKDDRVIELERWEKGWKIVAPINAKADNPAVEKFIKNVTDSRNDADYVMDPDPTPDRLAEFGLDKPKVILTLKVGKKLKPYTIMFGDRAPTMGVAFARLQGRKAVYRVLADARSEADKGTYYFRDKTVLRLNPVLVDQMVIKRPEGVIRVGLPQDGKWRLISPVKAIADHNKVFELLGVFANAEVKEFIDETRDHLSAYGLDKPSITFLLWKAGGDSKPAVRLWVGKRSPEKRGYYCAMSDRDNVFLLEEDVIHAIPRQGNELRSRELFFVDREKLKRIEVHRQGKAAVLVKDVNREWRKGDVKGKKVDFNTVKEFLDALMAQKVQDFVDDRGRDLEKYGLSSPSIRLLIWQDKGALPISLNIGGATPAGYVYARSGSDKTVLALDSGIRKILTDYF